MIKRVTFDEELTSVWENDRFFSDKANVGAFKIYALWLCYGTKYDFCRFYTADGAVICEQDGSFVVSDYGDCCFEEMAEFFSMNDYNEIFCSERAGKALSDQSENMRRACCLVDLMRFNKECVMQETENIENCTPLEEFYSILRTGFDIEFEPWYLDMSHRIRHGVASTRRLGGSVLVIQHDLFGSALISQVATIPEERGKGGASRLLAAVCAELSESEVFVICEDKLCGFYEKNGFVKAGKNIILRSV